MVSVGRDDMCALHPAWDAATRAIEDSLGKTSLAALAEVDAGLAGGVYSIPEASHRRQARAGGRPPATRAPASEARDGGPAPGDSNGQGPGTARGGDDD